MTGQISEDGKWVWNGNKWVPRPPPSYEGQEMEVQPKQAITPTPKVVHHITADPAQQFVSPQPVIEYNQPVQQAPIMIVQQPNSRKWGVGKIAVISVVLVVVLVAATVVLSGVLYVWGNSLEDDNQGSIQGTWYNPEDTITFYPNGTLTESTGTMTHWTFDGNGDLITTLLIDGEEIDIKWKYDIKSDSERDAILFLAIYESENGTQTNVIDETSCIAFSDSVLGSDHQHFDDRRAIFPDWCDPDHD